MLGGQITNHPHGDELAKLIEDDRTVLGWLVWVVSSLGFLGRKPAETNHFLNL
jgi:hypothetical protein